LRPAEKLRRKDAQAIHDMMAIGVKFTVEFTWQDNERAAYPNWVGYMPT
jgi:hypothetical protein